MTILLYHPQGNQLITLDDSVGMDENGTWYRFFSLDQYLEDGYVLVGEL